MLLCSEEDVEGNHSSSAGKIGDKELFYIMSRGFELKDLQQELKSQDLEMALDNAGDEDLEISAYDQIMATAGPDIALHINYYTENVGPRVTLFYDLTAYDAYTNKQVATTSQ